nr:UDP-N-acetylmuramoylalanyl-D-glutamyl-2,6-diaminopimelate--D-alanyl-D-alanine ligase [Hartmannibacter diazotrophicus]
MDAREGTGGPPPLWTASDFVAALKGRVEGDIPERIEGISIDSRSGAPGEAFFAIKGDRFDGHDFAVSALQNGAAVAVVSEARRADLPADLGPLVVVDDVLAALTRLAAAARARSRAKIIAVTGSVGKTSTKEALRRTLSETGTVHASLASFNNHWGVPLSLARLPADDDFGIFEIGMNHAGEITPLTKLVRPHVAIVTTVSGVHLEHFNSIEDIADAKAEIFEGLEPGGVAVLNADNPFFGRLVEKARSHGARVVSFGSAQGADARRLKQSLAPAFSTVTANILGETMTYKIGAPGQHLVENSLAVMATVALVNGDLWRASTAMQDLQQPKGRGRRHVLKVKGGEATLIDESYNANPESMRAALRILGLAAPGENGRRIAVLGDMLELGPEAAKFHRWLATVIANNDVNVVHTAGPLMANLHEALGTNVRGMHGETSAALRQPLIDDLRPGDVVMIKGSLGSRMAPLVDALIAAYGDEAATE